MEKTTGETVYHVFEKGKAGLEFTDPAKAGEAWHKAALAVDSTVIVKTPEGKAKLYAGAGETKGQVYKDLPFDNMPGAAEFKQAFKDSMQREKAELSMPTSKADYPQLMKPEVGKVYEGKIVAMRENMVIQAVKDGANTYHVEHVRAGLQSTVGGQLMQGKDLSIRYPFSPNVGIVKDRMEMTAKPHEHQPKGFGGIGR
jgi:hypothetical protein